MDYSRSATVGSDSRTGLHEHRPSLAISGNRWFCTVANDLLVAERQTTATLESEATDAALRKLVGLVALARLASRRRAVRSRSLEGTVQEPGFASIQYPGASRRRSAARRRLRQTGSRPRRLHLRAHRALASRVNSISLCRAVWVRINGTN